MREFIQMYQKKNKILNKKVLQIVYAIVWDMGWIWDGCLYKLFSKNGTDLILV